MKARDFALLTLFEKNLSLYFKTEYYVSEEIVVKNGDIPSGLGFIHRGFMYAIHPDAAAGAMVKLGPGDFYGEMGLVRGMRSPLIIQTITNCEVWVFNRSSYMQLLEHLPQQTKQRILINYLDILKVQLTKKRNPLTPKQDIRIKIQTL